MIRLYGMPLSNFYSMTKHAILEKGLEVECEDCFPNQEPELLARSPMGKVPFVETPEGFLTESTVIMEYLEDVHPEPALMPTNPYEKALVRRMMKTVELYIEAPIHPLVGALFGRDVPEYIKENSPFQAKRGLAAMARMTSCTPWLCGDRLTYADIVAYYSFTLARRLTKLHFDWDLLEDVPGLTEWYERFGEREVTRQVLEDMQASSEAILGSS